MHLSFILTLFSLSPVSPCQTIGCPEDDLQEESGDEKKKQLRDIVDLHESVFTVRIQPPGIESFELQVPLLFTFPERYFRAFSAH